MKQHSAAEVAVVPAGTRDDDGAKLWRSKIVALYCALPLSR